MSDSQRVPTPLKVLILVVVALSIPVGLIFLAGAYETGRYLYAQNAVNTAARYAIRTAVTQSWDDAYCQGPSTGGGPLDLDRDGTPCSSDDEQHIARLPTIRDAALAGIHGVWLDPTTTATDDTIPGYFFVSICNWPTNYTKNNDRYIPNPGVAPAELCANPTGAPLGLLSPGVLPNHPGLHGWAMREARTINGHPGLDGDHLIITVSYRHTVVVPGLNLLFPEGVLLQATRDGIVEWVGPAVILAVQGPAPTVAPTLTPTLAAPFTAAPIEQ